MMYVKLGIIDVKNGMKYRKEFMRTAIDIRKLFNGGGMMSFIGKTLLSGLAEAADFELKFPLKMVSILKKKIFCKLYIIFQRECTTSTTLRSLISSRRS